MKLFEPVFNWWYDLNSSMKEINPLVSFIFSILTLAMLIINIAMLPFLGVLVSIDSVFRGINSLTRSYINYREHYDFYGHTQEFTEAEASKYTDWEKHNTLEGFIEDTRLETGKDSNNRGTELK